ncbi:NepR family anti-sigma factor [Swingsia samuiensis]|uniref:NepR family anti-sigma factor n=1 Tax=Swingsia samuiensis TaxID=1293412 RepID=UPI0015E8C908|nr:NepR family anti-sigma factor [Swingsia samuiensis]
MTGGDQSKPSSGKPEDDNKESPFAIWLSRELHQLFDDVANEPIPDSLLNLIEKDRNKE